MKDELRTCTFYLENKMGISLDSKDFRLCISLKFVRKTETVWPKCEIKIS